MVSFWGEVMMDEMLDYLVVFFQKVHPKLRETRLWLCLGWGCFVLMAMKTSTVVWSDGGEIWQVGSRVGEQGKSDSISSFEFYWLWNEPSSLPELMSQETFDCQRQLQSNFTSFNIMSGTKLCTLIRNISIGNFGTKARKWRGLCPCNFQVDVSLELCSLGY